MKFNYAPLVVRTVTIRVLVVEPGTWDEPIICSLRHADLQDEPHLEAISYCWGGSVKSHAVILHGSPLAVTKNAHGALRNFPRECGQSQPNLWVDSMCIKQGNEAEKAHQVGIMGDIYRKSAHTLVWLGQDDGNIADAVKPLRSLVQEMDEQTQEFEWSRMDAMNVDVISAGASDSHQWPYPACVGKVVNLYELPWCPGLRVVQEVILSPFSTFAGGNGMFGIPETRAGLWNASGMWEKFDVEHGMNAKSPAPQLERLSLCELVWNTLRSNASEPKDRIFAILGLTKWSAANTALPEVVRPDYSKNLYYAYRDAIKVDIAERKELGIFEGGIVDQQSIFSSERIHTPTWVASVG